ncbi:DUF2510 domain-containing protein [Micromonosporaceae bacterium Da 78-11]
MTIAPQRDVPADWYPDPSGLPEQRWWDGRQWTDYLRPVSATGPAGGSVRDAVPGPRPAGVFAGAPVSGRNAVARYALVLGLLSVLVNPFLVPSVLAIVCGLLGIRRANRRLRAGRVPIGGASAAWGLAAGVAGLALSVAFKSMLL